MKLICQSRISREFKKAKADSVWPEYYPSGHPEANPNAEGLPICGGTVSVAVSVSAGCSCCSTNELELELTCSRCKMPWVGSDVSKFSYEPNAIAAELIAEALAARQQS